MENFTYLSDEQFAAIELAETQLVTVNKNIVALTVLLKQANQKTNKQSLSDSVKFSKMLNDMQAKRVQLLNIINQ
jgi:hypothetical protein